MAIGPSGKRNPVAKMRICAPSLRTLRILIHDGGIAARDDLVANSCRCSGPATQRRRAARFSNNSTIFQIKDSADECQLKAAALDRAKPPFPLADEQHSARFFRGSKAVGACAKRSQTIGRQNVRRKTFWV
jgi:hypothetical protein